jgi:hypothetical protein
MPSYTISMPRAARHIIASSISSARVCGEEGFLRKEWMSHSQCRAVEGFSPNTIRGRRGLVVPGSSWVDWLGRRHNLHSSSAEAPKSIPMDLLRRLDVTFQLLGTGTEDKLDGCSSHLSVDACSARNTALVRHWSVVRICSAVSGFFVGEHPQASVDRSRISLMSAGDAVDVRKTIFIPPNPSPPSCGGSSFSMLPCASARF